MDQLQDGILKYIVEAIQKEVIYTAYIIQD